MNAVGGSDFNRELIVNSVEIIDAIGKTLITINSDIRMIDVSELPGGMYFIRLKTGVEVLTKKLIKN